MGRVVKARDIHVRPGRAGAGDPTGRVRDGLSSLAQMLESNERRVVDLAVAMAGKLVGDSVERDPARLGEMYLEAVEKVGGHGPGVILRINPQDAPLVPLTEIRASRNLEVIEDGKIMRFSCIVEAGGIRVEHGLAPMVEHLTRSAGRHTNDR